jgi:hypothetical protein
MDSLALSDLGAGGDRTSSLTYCRFELTSKDRGLASGDLLDLMVSFDKMSWDERVSRWHDLLRLGRTAAEAQIAPDVFAPAFDVRRLSH